MGLPAEKLVIATNENDILNRFFTSNGHYTKKPVHGAEAAGGITADGAKAHADGVKETLSPAMDILVSSNFERLLWFLAFGVDDVSTSVKAKRASAGRQIKDWLDELKRTGGFAVTPAVIAAAKLEFESERVSNDETVASIRHAYSSFFPTQGSTDAVSSQTGGYILDPHSAIGVAASLRSLERSPPGTAHISLATAHAAKFGNAVDLSLKGQAGYEFSEVLPEAFVGLEERESRVTDVKAGAGWVGVREIVKEEVEAELEGKR